MSEVKRLTPEEIASDLFDELDGMTFEVGPNDDLHELALKTKKAGMKILVPHVKGWQDELTALRAENARLRKALDGIVLCLGPEVPVKPCRGVNEEAHHALGLARQALASPEADSTKEPA